MAKLNIMAFGIALGLTWGGAMLILGLVNIGSNWGSGIQQMMSTLYIGYKPTILGSIIGGIWGFFDAGIGGVVIAWLYNRLVRL